MHSARQPSHNTLIVKLRGDWQYWLAMAVALLYWAGLYLATTPQLQPGWPLQQPWLFLSLVLLYPVMEEVVFRGLIQDAMHRYLTTPSWYPTRFPVSQANLLTSLLFTVLHFINHAPMWAALVLIPSLIFGYFKDRHQHLAAPILLHVWYNLGYFWIFGAPTI